MNMRTRKEQIMSMLIYDQFLFKHTDLSHYLEKYPSGLHPHNAKVQSVAKVLLTT